MPLRTNIFWRFIMKRMMSLIVALFLTITMLMACRKSDNQVDTSSGRPHVIIKILGRDGVSHSSIQDNDEIGAIIYEKFNTEIQFIPFSESRYEKALMMLAAQDFADLDIVNMSTPSIISQYIDGGFLVNLDDYRDKLPQFFSFHEDTIPYWRDYDKTNGDLYVWDNGPDQSNVSIGVGLDMIVRTDLLEQQGYPDLDTTDDYIAFLKKALMDNPTSNGRPSIGMIAVFGDTLGPLLASYLPRHSGYQHPYKTTALIDTDTGGLVPLVTHRYTKENAKFWNTLWREGILDREAFTTTWDILQEKIESGTALSMHFASWLIGGANMKATERGQPDKHYIVMPIRQSIAKREGRNSRYEIFTKVRIDDTQGILKSSKNIDRIIELIEFFSNEEINIRANWGLEGRDWTRQNGKIVSTPEFIAKTTGPDALDFMKQFGTYHYQFPFPSRSYAELSNGQGGSFNLDATYSLSSATDTQKKAYKGLGWENPSSGFTANKNFTYESFDMSDYQTALNLDPDSDEVKIEERILNYFDQQWPAVITAGSDAEFERQFKTLVDTCLSYGNERLVTKYNQQLSGVSQKIEALSSR
jgi:hypothetical protein